ncbi:hypothetical protein [Corynebacterium mastitidis]
MAITQELKDRWAAIDTVVFDHRKSLRAMSDHRDLKKFAEEQGWNNGSDFAAFKRALVKIRVDYEQVREETQEQVAQENAQKAEQLAQLGEDVAQVWLWVAAVEDSDSGQGSFALVDAEDDPVWYGDFHEQDRVREVGDVVSAEQSVAHKAIWLAGKALEAAGASVGRLHLTTMCPFLDEEALSVAGAKSGLAVVLHVDPEDQRAVEMAEAPGFMSYKQRDLSELVDTDE